MNHLQESTQLVWVQANEGEIDKQCGIWGDLKKAASFMWGGKSTKAMSTQEQTRSVDEPMMVFVLCVDCGKRWKC
jgi:transcription elongation factor S-II